MSMIKQSLLKNKFALANFILLNEPYCEISSNDLYVIQVIEQYQNQFNQALDFSKIEQLISMDIDKFKLTLNLLISRKLVVSKFELVGELNTLKYDFTNFWNHVVDKVIDFEKLNLKQSTHELLHDYISNKFNRMLTTSEIIKLEQVVEMFELEILKEIVDQCVVQNSTYIETFISLVKMYKDANCQNLIEVQSTYNSLGM